MLIDDLKQELAHRRDQGLYRSLRVNQAGVDFWSNDYLGLGRRDIEVKAGAHGSTGSRLLSGSSKAAEELENQIAKFLNAESALLFNSGYDANLGLLSSVPKRGDTIVYDELCHASMRDGIRLSHAKSFHFAHNDLQDLRNKARGASGRVFIVVESLYSMDGDFAPLKELCDLRMELGAEIFVDEAHATGIFGKKGEGLVSALGLESQVFARVHTFGKALGAHGGAIAGSAALREYLINFARSFIYTTALPDSVLNVIAQRFQYIPSASAERGELFGVIEAYRSIFSEFSPVENSPIQKIIVPGNESARLASNALREAGFNVPAILSPTVPEGSERLRVSLHSFNTPEDIQNLHREVLRAL